MVKCLLSALEDKNKIQQVISHQATNLSWHLKSVQPFRWLATYIFQVQKFNLGTAETSSNPFPLLLMQPIRSCHLLSVYGDTFLLTRSTTWVVTYTHLDFSRPWNPGSDRLAVGSRFLVNFAFVAFFISDPARVTSPFDWRGNIQPCNDTLSKYVVV